MRVLRLTGLSACLFLFACGGTDNVKLCQDFEAQIKCGDYDVSTQIDCSIWKSTSCDIGPYWDCLTNNFKCTDNVPDKSGWATCQSLENCP